MKPVEDDSKAVQEYVLFKNPKLMPVVEAMESLVRRVVPDARLGVNSWGVPTFATKEGTFAWFMVNKGHVTFGFDMGTSLSDPEGLLEGTGVNYRHVKIRKVEDVGKKGLRDLVQAAARHSGRVY